MKFMVCPQCGISNLFVKNNKEEQLNIKISREFEIVPIDSERNTKDFNTEIIYCLGCSWKGNIKQLKKYLI